MISRTTHTYFISAMLGLLTVVSSNLTAQTLTTSNLPIIIVDTKGQRIPDEPKIIGTMAIIDNRLGQRNNVQDAPTDYNGNIGIETRGNSTQDFDKKTYSLELRTEADKDTSVSLLGMPAEEDWILHAMVIDKSQLRIPLSFDLFEQMGHYSIRWRYVELVLNDEYQGLYILCERLKRDKERIDIAKMSETDVSGDEVTGGYILRIDWLDYAEGFESQFDSQSGYPMFYQWYYPKAKDIQDEQSAYISSFINEFESAVFAPNYRNNQNRRYNEYINLHSFSDFLLINELSKNSDGYKLSSYLHKERDSEGGALRAGPIWDFDQTFGVSTVCSNHVPSGWTYLQNQAGCEDLESMPMWWSAMMKDSTFLHFTACRWDSLKKTVLSKESIYQWIDSNRDLIAEAIDRNFTKWNNFIGEEIWYEPSGFPQTYNGEITYLKEWIGQRWDWIDRNLPGDCDRNTLTNTDNTTKYYGVWPNPSSGTIFIQSPSNAIVRLINLQGKLIEQLVLSTGLNQIKLNSSLDGIYFLEFPDGRMEKIILNN